MGEGFSDRQRNPMGAILGSGSIVVSFQPVVELADGAAPIHAYECLCGGPAGSLVESPTALIRLSRELRIESEVDQAALAASLEAALSLPEKPRLHLTAHARTVARPGFAEGFLAALDGAQIDPARVLLSLLDPDPIDTSALLRARNDLRMSGVFVGLDVDRRIYAAPHALVHLSPDVLRLESTLVRRAARHNLDQALLSSVNRLARSVGAHTLLRDVDTEEERDLALAHGFRFAQGKLFGLPQPAAGAGPQLAIA